MLRRYLAGPTLIRDTARAGRFTGQPVVRRCQDGSGAVGRRASGWIWPAGLTVCPAVTTLIGRGGGNRDASRRCLVRWRASRVGVGGRPAVVPGRFGPYR